MTTEDDDLEIVTIGGDQYVGYTYLKDDRHDCVDYINSIRELVEKQIPYLTHEEFDAWNIHVPWKHVNEEGDWVPTLH